MLGKVKWFSHDKGYGFVTSENDEDHYFNVQSIQGSDLPSNGDKVSFDSKPGNKGPRAFNVSIVSKAESSNGRSGDDRIHCPSCNKKIVPRMITYQGNPTKTLCPYCGAVVKEFSNCFIATAVYGDPNCSEVRILRNFRDEFLLKNAAGKIFVAFYYRFSPPLAAWIKRRPRLSLVFKPALNVVVKRVAHNNKRKKSR